MNKSSYLLNPNLSLLTKLQLLRHSCNFLFQFKNSSFCISRPLIRFVPELHQGVTVLMIKQALSFPFLTLPQQVSAFLRQFLVLLHELLQRLCVHTRFRLKKKDQIFSQLQSTTNEIKKTQNELLTLTRSSTWSFSFDLERRARY